MNRNDDYDFGFSFENDEPLDKGSDSEIEERYKAKLLELENLILPLLNNLMKNPEKAYIKWENRTEVIQKQMEKILAITRSD